MLIGLGLAVPLTEATSGPFVRVRAFIRVCACVCLCECVCMCMCVCKSNKSSMLCDFIILTSLLICRSFVHTHICIQVCVFVCSCDHLKRPLCGEYEGREGSTVSFMMYDSSII